MARRGGRVTRRGRPGQPSAIRGLVGSLAALLLVLGAAPLSAQAFDAPAFHTPYGESGYGLYLFFPENDVGVMGTWRASGPDLDLGFRAGAMGLEGTVGLLGAVEVKSHVVPASDEFPLDVAWVSGVGVTGFPDSEVDDALLRIPLGFSFGRAVGDDEVAFVPYIHPRLSLDMLFPDGPTDLRFDLDLGFDASFSTAWRLRFGVTLGHYEAVGIGLGFRDF